MNVITNEISIDLMKPTDIAEVHAVQGERNTRCVRMFLLSDGKPWQIPENTLLAIRYGGVARSSGYYDTLPDGSDAWEYDGNAITLRLTPQMMSSAGSVFVQVEMIQEDQMLATFSFKLLVAANPAIDVVEPETYVNWLQWMKNQLESHIQSLIDSGSLIGPMGPQGDPASVTGMEVVYQVSNSATITPTGTWSSVIPNVPDGEFLWTRTTIIFNSTTPVTFYSVARMGKDGLGGVASVCNVTPDAGGNVALTAADVGALPSEDTHNLIKRAAPYNLLDNSDFRNPVNQRGQSSYTGYGYTIDRWSLEHPGDSGISLSDEGIVFGATSSLFILVQKVSKEVRKKLIGKTVTVVVTNSDGGVGISTAVVPEFGVALDSPQNKIGSTDLIVNVICDSAEEGFRVRLFTGNLPSPVTIANIALYEGEYTAETLPEYQPKGYGAELFECQRYYEEIYVIESTSVLNWNTSIPFKVKKRIDNPTAILVSNNGVEGKISYYDTTAGWVDTDARIYSGNSEFKGNAVRIGLAIEEGEQVSFSIRVSADL